MTRIVLVMAIETCLRDYYPGAGPGLAARIADACAEKVAAIEAATRYTILEDGKLPGLEMEAGRIRNKMITEVVASAITSMMGAPIDA